MVEKNQKKKSLGGPSHIEIHLSISRPQSFVKSFVAMSTGARVGMIGGMLMLFLLGWGWDSPGIVPVFFFDF